MNTWLKTGSLIAAVWLVAAIVIHIVRASQPTAASISAYVHSVDLNSLEGDARSRAIKRMEDMVNDISFDERQQLDRSRVNHDFFDKLTPDEQSAYLDATLPTGFQQLMDSFNKMDPVKRKQIVADALARMKENQDGGAPPGADTTVAQHVIDQGLKSYYRDADADTKLDLAPLVEQMQVNLQHR